MLAFAPLVLILAAADPAPARAELCVAYVQDMIAEAQRETGRVAGPSWFIRDWWSARRPEPGEAGALDTEQRARLALSIETRRTADPAAYRAELQSCVTEAIDGGALP